MNKEVSEQVNSVLDKLTEILSLPAEALKEAGQWGFTKRVAHVKMQGLSELVMSGVEFLIVIICGVLMGKVLSWYLKIESPDSEEEFRGICPTIVLGVIMLICLGFGISDLADGLPLFLEPEGVVVKELLNQL